MRHTQFAVIAAVILSAAVSAGACGKKKPPVARPMPTPAGAGTTTNAPPAPPTPVPDTTPIPPEPRISNDPLASGDLDTINKNSPFQPVFFRLDSFEIEGPAQQALTANAEILKKYPTWVITIEGHCDERGTAEYNLALGDRRARSVQQYLVSNGIGADRLTTVSFGEEQPKYDNSREETRRLNRRAAMTVQLVAGN
jgi:peptidoglycan-associated lipoprotein